MSDDMSARVTLAAQIALGAAFGTAIAWKTVHQRQRTARVGALARVGDPAPLALPAGGIAQDVAAMKPPGAAGGLGALMTEGIPDRLRIAIIVLAVVAVPLFIGVTCALNRSSATPVAQPQAAATPTLAERQLDTRRARDLQTVRQAADAYASLFGAFPTTDGALTPLCLGPADPGCAIRKYATDFPTSDGQHPYWYASDGSSLTLAAQVSAPPARDDCPPGLTAPLGDVPVLCVRSSVAAP